MTVYSLEKPSFSATAKCKYGGCTVNVSACTGDGLPYILKGCSPNGALVAVDLRIDVDWKMNICGSSGSLRWALKGFHLPTSLRDFFTFFFRGVIWKVKKTC